MKRAIALIIVVGLLAGGFLYMRKVDREDRRRMNELYASVEPLQRQREALAAERESMAVDYALQMRDVGTAELLFRELDSNIFKVAYPKMRDQGIVGVLGVNRVQFPGYPNKLSVEQYNRLLKDGWGSCLIYESYVDFDAWYREISTMLELENLAVPRAIFFPDNTYDSALDEKMTAVGIETVILNAENGHSNTVSPVGDGLWFTGAMPWNYTGVNADTDLLTRTDGANLVFTISFNNLWDSYEEAAFTKTLSTWSSILVSDDALPVAESSTGETRPVGTEDDLLKPLLRVVSLEQARLLHRNAAEVNASLVQEQIEREEAVDREIEELDEQIREFYTKWSDKSEEKLLLALWHKLGF